VTHLPGGFRKVDPDASEAPHIGLLTQVMTQTLDQDYASVARRRDPQVPDPSPRWRIGALSVLLVFGLMLGVSALTTDQEQPLIAAERAELIEQIEAGQSKLADQQQQLAALSDEVARMQSRLAAELTDDRLLSNRLTALGVAAGTIGVTGPGVVVTVDDARYTGAESGGVVLDTDLQLLVNGLWEAGAEAVSIDDHRLTSLTSIRLAGEAITVDYRSLAPPYVIEATGDPDTMPARLLETRGGQFWLDLKTNYGVQFEIVAKSQVSIPADLRDHLLYAAPRRAT